MLWNILQFVGHRPTTKNYPTPNVNSSDLEKPCSKGMWRPCSQWSPKQFQIICFNTYECFKYCKVPQCKNLTILLSLLHSKYFVQCIKNSRFSKILVECINKERCYIKPLNIFLNTIVCWWWFCLISFKFRFRPIVFIIL